jgi:hypothetical protein
MSKIIQSGFKLYALDVHTLHCQAAAGLYMYTPSASADWDNVAGLQADSQSYNYDITGISFAQYIYFGLWTQALAWQRYMTITPSPAWWTPGTNSVLAYWIDNFTKGMLDDEFPALNNTEGIAAHLKEFMEGVSWDDEGVGGNDKHWQKLRVLAYAFGLKRRADVPPISEKSTDAQIKSRQIYMTIRAIRDVKKVVDLFPMMGLSSDKLAVAFGKIVHGYVPETVPKEMYGSEIDSEWNYFMEKGKQDLVGTNPTFETSSGYRSYVKNFFNYTYLRTSDFDNVLRFAGTEIYVDADALKMARMFTGVGKISINGEDTWFVNMFNMAINSSGGSWDTHMVSGSGKQWFVGVNMAMVLNMYDDPVHEKWYKGFEKISDYDHWTGALIKAMSSDMIQTDIKSATKGQAEADVHRPLMSTITYTDSDANRLANGGWLESPQVPDPTISVDSNSPYNPLYGATLAGLRGARHSWFFLLFAMDTFANIVAKRDGIGFVVDNWTKAEQSWISFIAILFGSGSSTFDGDSKFAHTRLLLFPMIDARNNDQVETICYTVFDVIRIRSLKNYQDWTNTPTFATKYSSVLLSYSNRLSSTEALMTGPRPKGLKDTLSNRTFNIGSIDNKKNRIIQALPSGASIADKFEAKASDSEKDHPDSPENSGEYDSPSAKASTSAKNVKSDGKPPTKNKDDE